MTPPSNGGLGADPWAGYTITQSSVATDWPIETSRAMPSGPSATGNRSAAGWSMPNSNRMGYGSANQWITHSDATSDPADKVVGSGKPVGKVVNAVTCNGCFYELPFWRVSAEVVGLRRREANGFPLIVDSSSSAVAINASDLDFSHELGLRFRATRFSTLPYQLEFGYLEMPQWQSERGVQGDLELNGPGFSAGSNPSAFLATYDSSLRGGEVNLRFQDCFVTNWFVGFRYLRFDEELVVSELFTPVDRALEVNTTNDLYGFHFGGDFVIYDSGGPFRSTLGIGFGTYANDAGQTTASSLVGTAVGTHGSRLAFTGELNVTLLYQLTQHWEVRGGYQVLGIGNLALAPDQIAVNDLSTGFSSLSVSSVIFDGGFLGVNYYW